MEQYHAFQGEDGMWGLADENDAVLYDPQFAKITADAMADLENAENPPKDWEETRDRLMEMGLPF